MYVHSPVPSASATASGEIQEHSGTVSEINIMKEAAFFSTVSLLLLLVLCNLKFVINKIKKATLSAPLSTELYVYKRQIQSS